MNEKDIIICRCEDITLAEIRQCLKDGYTTMDEIKRILRTTMGPCQGTTCANLIQREIANFHHQKLEDVKLPKTRPLTIGVPLKDIAGSVDE